MRLMLGRFMTCDQLLLFFMFYILVIFAVVFASSIIFVAGMCNLLSSVSTFSSWLYRACTHCYSYYFVISTHVRESGIRNPANICCWNQKSTMVWNQGSGIRKLGSGIQDLHEFSYMGRRVSVGICAFRCRWASKLLLVLVWAWTISAIRISILLASACLGFDAFSSLCHMTINVQAVIDLFLK